MTKAHRNSKAGGFAAAFFRQVPAEDVAGWKPQELESVAESMHGWALVRKPGHQKVRVFTPEPKLNGFSHHHTVIEIVNDDMSFIIDSISAELAARGLAIEVLFHPILTVMRDGAGKLAAKGAELVESHVFIRLEQLLSDADAASLADRLYSILDDVRAATGDWHAMLEKVGQVIAAQDDKNAEARDFLVYIQKNNFTFLGYRAFRFTENGKTQSRPAPGSDLGIMRNNKTLYFGHGADSPEVRALKGAAGPVMICKLIDKYSTVHRRVPLDAVVVKMTDKQGNLAGMHLFLGLFTSSTYSCRTADVPLVRAKVAGTIHRAGFAAGTHDRTALEHILEKMPRDELFQVTEDELSTIALGILRLQSKQRVALFTHMDPMRQYMSCLVYVPRDRYNTKFRSDAAAILEAALQGRVTNHFTSLDDSALARVLFTINLGGKQPSDFDRAATERQLIDIGREWDERLREVLVDAHGKREGLAQAQTYGRAFTTAYHESIDINNAVHDVRRLEALGHSGEAIAVDLYRLTDAAAGTARLKVYHSGNPVPLSAIMPVLENMGLKCISEMPYEVRPQGAASSVWIHDFALDGAEGIDLDTVKKNFEEAFLQVWKERAENDGLNQLVLRANLTWREVMILRTYSSFMRQARFPFSRTYVEQVLGLYPQIAAELVKLFKDMHDPAAKTKERGKASGARIIEMLQSVQKLDHDRILRGFKMLIEKTLRTSYFQVDADGHPKTSLAVKLDSKNITDLPLPRPYVEIFVYSTRVEAVHLRGGEIARGGIRWSDRADDFRTEVLSLMKSQMVKNTVIVPVGAKGGFIVKQPPKTGGREAYQKEGVECYKIFVSALLDITDNNVGGKVVRPKNVVCHDGIDPYLVVAADKGTATFSDIANEISRKADFWLQDAFASGGSAGYDHKAIGITARGGWESVKRHFREMDKDIQKEPFTLVGVGDMAGDVFGNAMLLSKQMKLVGAFNHVHIFCDPEPDIAASFAERARMFKERLGWDAYDKSKLSAGGMIYERSAKTLKLTPQIKKCFGIDESEVTPDELMRAILKAEVELLWFGGIGTFLKSSRQSNADADDKSNDNLRINASEVRALVIGEGANLGCTQLARVEYARRGGRINTDFVDNSGGVDCSDHEVNIKILLADVRARGKMTLPARNKLLEQMTDDVAALVLRDNYQQTQALSLLEYRAKSELGVYAEFIRDLEKAGLINRQLEGLPDEETLTRLGRDGIGLTRPELSVLLAYAKMTLYTQLLKSSIPDDPALERLLFDYFPARLHKYDAEIRAHKLKREIIATQVVNTLVNRMGPVFVRTRVLKTGASAEEVIKAFMIVVDAFGIEEAWAAVEALDNKVPGRVQMAALFEVSQMVKRGVTWFLRFGRSGGLRIEAEIDTFKPGIETLKKGLGRALSDVAREELKKTEAKLAERGMPQALAAEISVLGLLSSANDIISISRHVKGDLGAITTAYFLTGDKLGLDWLRRQASQLTPENSWAARAISGLLDDFYAHQAALTEAILRHAKKGKQNAIEDWFRAHEDQVAKVLQLVAEMKAEAAVKLEMLTLVSQRVGQLVDQVR